jgi:EmrB/QacA subfamily drug resistance transporter
MIDAEGVHPYTLPASIQIFPSLSMSQSKSPWFIFLLVAIAQFMVVLDASITNVALPAIKAALHFDTNTLQWVVTSYALTFGGFLLLGGRAADLLGHRRMLVTGLAGFTFISLLIGFSMSSTMLIVLRAMQGMCGALLSPAAMSIILITFPEGNERNKAFGYWTTIATVGAAAGLLLGGIITQYLGWRWNFFVNVPVGILTCYFVSKYVPTHKQEIAHSDLDIPGAALVTGGLTLFVYVISEAPVWGWLSPATLLSGALAIALLLGFIWNESRIRHPLMPLTMFTRRNIVGANLMMAPIMAGAFGMFFLISLYIQSALHYSPLLTGLSFLPFPIILGVISPRIAPFVGKYGYKIFSVVGPLVVAASIAWLIRLPVAGNYFTDILPIVILMPVGLAFTFMPIIVAATSGVAENESGLASGLINTSQQMGGALGLAVLSSIAASATASHASLGPLESLVFGYDRAFFWAMMLVLIATALGGFIIKEKKVGPMKPEQMQAHGM